MQITSFDIAIADFWNWFSGHSRELGDDNISDDLINQLEQKLFAIHQFDWEIGPGQRKPHFFALSPRGDESLLELTRRVVVRAPNLPTWEFYPAKPQRDWNLVFDLIVEEKAVEIDGKLWQFVVYEFNDGTYELLLKPESAHGLSAEYLCWAATIIADGELGEEKRMDLIKNIDVVRSWDEENAQSARNLEVGLLAKALTFPLR